MRKRLLAFLLSLCMIFSLLPVTAFAAGDTNVIRLMDRDEWRTAAFTRAGIAEEGEINIQRIFVYDVNNNQLGNGDATGVDLIGTDWFRTFVSVAGIDSDSIGRIAIAFTQTVGASTKTVWAMFGKGDFQVSDTGGPSGTKYAALRLTDQGKQKPSGNQVNFYLEVGAEAGTWSLYDTVYVADDTALADKMPSPPSFGGDYVFVCWELNSHNGTGQEFTKNTVVSEDIDVYARKVNAGSASHARVHNENDDVWKKVADSLDTEVGQIADINGMSLVGSDGVEGNPHYDGTVGIVQGINANQWVDNGAWFAICNLQIPVAADDGWNNKVSPDDIQGIKIYGTLLGGSEFGPVFVSRDQLDVRVVNDTWIDIFLRHDETKPETYELTYMATSGKVYGQDSMKDTNLTEVDGYLLRTDGLSHDASPDGTAVVFVGWTTSNDAEAYNKIYSRDDTLAEGFIVTTVDIPDVETVYAIWGYDTNGGKGNGTADVLETKYTVTYTDGVEGEEVFADQKDENLLFGDLTPSFTGELNRDGWNFTGWSPALEEKVTDSQTYTATWSEKVSTIYVVFQYSPEMGGSIVELGEGTVTSADAPGAALRPPVDEANETAPIGMKFTGWQVYGKGTVNTFDYTTLAGYADPNNWGTDENGNPFTTVYIDAVYEPTTLTLPVVFVDEETGLEVKGGTESVTVPADKQTVALSELTPPTGYVLSENNADPTTAKNDQFTIFVKQNRTITINYNISDPSQGYLTQAPGKMFYHETFPEAKSGLYSLEGVTAAPGYTFTGWSYNGEDSGILPAAATLADVLQHVVWNGAEGFITVSPIFERITRDVTVRFVDKVTGETVGDSYTMAVAPDAYSVKTSDIDSSWIPEGYELAEQGDLMIDNDVVTVPVRRIAPTDAELKALLLNLQVDCTTEGHEPITTGLLDGSYTVTGDGLGVQGDYYYIQLNTAPYVAAYDAYSETHTGVDGSTMTIVLYHDDIKWIVPDTLMVRLNCERAVYNTIHVSFVNYVDGKDVSLGSGDVISTAPSVKLETPAPSGFTPEGKTFVGWKVRLGNSPMYEGEFTYDALYALMQAHNQDFYENQAWLTFEPVFADDYRVIHLKFVDEDENVIGSGDVISTYPDQEYDLPDPAPFAPAGQSFVGWKVWVNGEPMYDGEFTFNALAQLLDSGFSGEEAWLTFQAVYADDYRVIHLKFVDRSEERRVGKECRSRWSPYH